MALKERFRQWWKSRKNLRNVDLVGEGVELWGTIEKRAPGAHIEIGDRTRITGYLVTETPEARLVVGRNTIVGSDTVVDCAQSIQIEEDVLISYQCILSDSDNHSMIRKERRDDLERWRTGKHDWSLAAKAPIVIRKGAWIGARSIIMKGVTVGEGAVVGMGSVVVRDVEPYTVVIGNPARAVRELPAE